MEYWEKSPGWEGGEAPDSQKISSLELSKDTWNTLGWWEMLGLEQNHLPTQTIP